MFGDTRLSQLGEQSSGGRPGMLLDILQGTGWSPTAKNYPAPISAMLRLRNLAPNLVCISHDINHLYQSLSLYQMI